jgi:hypothetical protein
LLRHLRALLAQKLDHPQSRTVSFQKFVREIIQIEVPNKKHKNKKSTNSTLKHMKPKSIKSLLALALLAPGALFAQTTAKTTPVGYITHTAVGNVAANPSGADTYLTPSLIPSASFAAAPVVDPSGLSVVTFSGSVPTGLTGVHVLEITSGTSEGFWTEVTATTATTVTVASPLPAALDTSTKFVLRKLPTLGSWVGASLVASGLSVVDGVNASPPDEIQLFNPLTQSAQTAVYVTTGAGVPTDGWYDFVTQADLTNEPIYPGESVVIKRYGATAISFVASGEVKTTKTQVDIRPNFNWVGSPYSVDSTLGAMSFAAILNKEDGDANTTPEADFLDILAADQSTASYVALDPVLGAGNIMANFVTQNDGSAIPIAGGTGFIINRSSAASASTITFPAQVIGN